MTRPPDNPKIYHITHVNNLSSIASEGCLWSDRKALQRLPSKTVVGMNRIKERRLNKIRVSCYPGTMIGDYVPFYYCPRSVMLFKLYKRNDRELEYKGGQVPIVHLQADLHAVVDWADEHGVQWALTIGNAGAFYVECFRSLDDLRKINWEAVGATWWKEPELEEGKQAEFLVYESLPFELVEEIGVINAAMQRTVVKALGDTEYEPLVRIHRDWYYP